MSDTSKKIKVAVDAMGGDFAPGEIVSGAIQAAREFDVEIIFTGPRADIEAELEKHDTSGLSIGLIEANEIIIEGEQPALAVLRKPNNPIAVAAKLVKEGEVDAMVSAGPTGAVMVSAFQYIGTLPGIDRPMIGGAFLGLAPNTIVLDLGANVTCQPYHLVNFAIAGTVYAKCFHGIEEPTVGLLNVGSEEGKGNDLLKEAYPLLKGSGLKFIGNVEGMDIPGGKANVIVCDGYVGNVLAKFSEGLSQAIGNWLSQELKDDLKPAVLESISAKMLKLIGPGAVLGGGPLWGVDGVAAIAHGNSRAPQIVNTISQVKRAIESGFVDKLRAELEKVAPITTAE
jgi:glycerol-3-phosphate acyltransferase PlsX